MKKFKVTFEPMECFVEEEDLEGMTTDQIQKFVMDMATKYSSRPDVKEIVDLGVEVE